MRTDHRTYKIEVSSGNNGTGTYQLKVRVNNICRINDDGDAQYQWAGGPEGYPATPTYTGWNRRTPCPAVWPAPSPSNNAMTWTG